MKKQSEKIDAILYIASLALFAWVSGCSFEHYKSDREDSWKEVEDLQEKLVECIYERRTQMDQAMLYARKGGECKDDLHFMAEKLIACQKASK